MAELSPAAQAVKDAVLALYSDEKVHKFGWKLDAPTVAAALRALADQVAPEDYSCYENDRAHDFGMETRNEAIREEILAIAAELEGADEPTFTPEEIEMIEAPWSYVQSQQEIKNE